MYYNNENNKKYKQDTDNKFSTQYEQINSDNFLNDPSFQITDYYGDFQAQTTPEAILLSDPTFMRQHQLLQHEQENLNNHDQFTLYMDKKQKKRASANRSQQTNSGGGRYVSIDDYSIDHQRRLNELQVRFRVNKQPSSNQIKSKNDPSVQELSPSPINTYNDDSSVYTCATATTSTTTTTASIQDNTQYQHGNQDSTQHQQKSQKIAPPNKIELPPSPFTSTLPPTTPPIIIGSLNSPRNDDELSYSYPSRTMPIQIQRVSRPSPHYDSESYQRQLDNQLDKVDFDDITVAELKEMLRQRGKPATGKKAVLVQRLQDERNNRYSHPLFISQQQQQHHQQQQQQQQQRPKSFQGTTQQYIQPLGSPLGSPGGQLYRSIANMQIGSPPNASRRYSPYSPRPTSNSSSPKLSFADQEYPSLLPEDTRKILPSSYNSSDRLTPGRYYNKKSYKPLTPSALATPDREEEVNPFDVYYENMKNSDIPIEEEDDHRQCLHNDNNANYIDWTDSTTLELLLQNGTYDDTEILSQPLYNDDIILSDEQIMALLNNQQQVAALNFKLDDSGFNTYN